MNMPDRALLPQTCRVNAPHKNILHPVSGLVINLVAPLFLRALALITGLHSTYVLVAHPLPLRKVSGTPVFRVHPSPSPLPPRILHRG